MKTPTVCFGSTCRRGLTCPCTRKPSSTKWLGSSTNDHARLWDLQPQPNDLMLVLHRPLERPPPKLARLILLKVSASSSRPGFVAGSVMQEDGVMRKLVLLLFGRFVNRTGRFVFPR